MALPVDAVGAHGEDLAVRGGRNPASVEAGRTEFARFLPVLEGALEGREWLEERFSLADITYAPHLWLARESGASLSATPRVAAWLARTMARPAWAEMQAMIFS